MERLPQVLRVKARSIDAQSSQFGSYKKLKVKCNIYILFTKHGLVLLPIEKK